jgi:acyl dehydratase
MSFPSSPTEGQRVTSLDRVWEWSNGAWRHVGNPPAPVPFAGLDAFYDRVDRPEPAFIPRAGAELWARIPQLGAITTNAPTVNEERSFPFVSPISGTIDRIATEVSTVNASSTFRFGVRANNGGLPGALIYGTATALLGSGTAGIREETVSIPVVANVLYWMSFVQHGTAATFRSTIGDMPLLHSAHGLSGTTVTCYTQTGVTGALPATFTLASISSAVPRIALRFTATTA